MSLVLAFDTATQATVVGLLPGGGTPIERRDDPAPGTRPRHTQRLLALCEEALAAAGAAWGDVDRIGVGVGPGSFTGLRIGVATARALGQARAVETVAVSTLAALAGGVSDERDVLAVLDARRGEAFASAFTADGQAAAAAVSVDPPDLAALGRPGWLAVGDGAVRYRAELEAGDMEVPPDDDPRHLVRGAVLVRLATAATPVPVATLVPDYVRLPDAEIHHRRVAAGP